MSGGPSTEPGACRRHVLHHAEQPEVDPTSERTIRCHDKASDMAAFFQALIRMAVERSEASWVVAAFGLLASKTSA